MVAYQELSDDLVRCADAETLSHAYLFFGPDEISTFRVAHGLCNYLEHKTFEIPSKLLQETMVLDGGEQNKGESVGIDQVRDLERFLYRSPVSSPYRCAVIRNAEWLTIHAQHALLKILEEPPSRGIIIATARDDAVFLDTVTSRFQRVYIPPASPDAILDFVKEYGTIDRLNATKIVSRAHGRMEKVRVLVEDKEQYERVDAVVDRIIAAKTASAIESIVEDVIVNSKEQPLFHDWVCEELLIRLHEDAVKHCRALGAISTHLFFMRSLNCNMRIQLKHALYTVAGI